MSETNISSRLTPEEKAELVRLRTAAAYAEIEYQMAALAVKKIELSLAERYSTKSEDA